MSSLEDLLNKCVSLYIIGYEWYDWREGVQGVQGF